MGKLFADASSIKMAKEQETLALILIFFFGPILTAFLAKNITPEQKKGAIICGLIPILNLITQFKIWQNTKNQ